MVRPHTLFEMFGHDCQIKTTFRVGRTNYPKKTSHLEKAKKSEMILQCFKRCLTINETNKAAYNFLRSYKRIENEYRKQLEYPYMIHPFSNFRYYWELIMIIIIILQIYMVSLDIAAFNYNSFKNPFLLSATFQLIRLITDTISFVDVIIQFFSGYLDHKNGVVVLKPMKVLRHYIFPQFVIDLICSFPGDFLLFIYEDYVNLHYRIAVIYTLHFLGFVKLIRYVTFVKYARNVCEGYGSYYIHKVMIALITFFIYLHVICCFSLAWNSWENPVVPGDFFGLRFKKSVGYKSSSFFTFYARFLYGACFLILNAGYSFHNNTETGMLFTVIIWIVSRLNYVIAIAYFMRLHISAYSSHQKYIDFVSAVKDYMEHKQIPDHLRKRIIAYYDIRFQNVYFREAEILSTVSGQLKQEIVMHKCKQLVQSVPFFQNIPLSLLVRIISSLEYEIFLTNDVIIKIGSQGRCMYFISKGTVALYTKSGREACHLQDYEYFGEAALVISKSVRAASVIAVEVCELYRLDRDKFIKAILPYPDLLEKIKYMALERVIKANVPEEISNYYEKFNP